MSATFEGRFWPLLVEIENSGVDSLLQIRNRTSKHYFEIDSKHFVGLMLDLLKWHMILCTVIKLKNYESLTSTLYLG